MSLTKMGKIIISLLLMLNVAVAQQGTTAKSQEHGVGSHDKKVVCYWATWANYRKGDGVFIPQYIDSSLCTNIMYKVVLLNVTSSTIRSGDPWLDLKDGGGLSYFEVVTKFKKRYPHLKVSVSTGMDENLEETFDVYLEMAKDPVKRELYVKSTVNFLNKYKLDGLDLDWQHTAGNISNPEVKEIFVALVRDLRRAFDSNSLILTAAIPKDPASIDEGLDLPQLLNYLDFIHVRGYDYHTYTNPGGRTGLNSPLRGRPYESDEERPLNIDYTLNYLLDRGAKPEQTILGMPLYGRSYLLENPDNHGIGDPTQNVSFNGSLSNENGLLNYNEICSLLKERDHGWTIVRDRYQDAPYMFKDDMWVSYDDEISIRKKVEYAMNKSLAGIMVWSIDSDDFRGTCEEGRKFPLLQAINEELHLRATKDEQNSKAANDGAHPRTIHDELNLKARNSSSAVAHISTLVITITLVISFFMA